ncbi:unnamed protein product, partial [Iphiclides podalirius]
MLVTCQCVLGRGALWTGARRPAGALPQPAPPLEPPPPRLLLTSRFPRPTAGPVHVPVNTTIVVIITAVRSFVREFQAAD